jgi:hypothetical protein
MAGPALVDPPAVVPAAVSPRVLPPPPPFVSGYSTFLNNPAKFQFDVQGVLRTNSPGIGWHYNAASIAQLTIAVYAVNYRTGSFPAADLRLLRANGTWLSQHMDAFVDGIGRAHRVYRMPAYPLFDMPAGGRSALTASQAMAALYVAGDALDNPALSRQAGQLISAFFLPVRDGGYYVTLPGPHATWFEEYAYPGLPAPRVLNGHMYTVATLDWYRRQTGDRYVAALVQLGINGLHLTIGQYDSLPISVYDLKHRTHSLPYHRAHVLLLRYFARLTGLPRFAYYADRWAALPRG